MLVKWLILSVTMVTLVNGTGMDRVSDYYRRRLQHREQQQQRLSQLQTYGTGYREKTAVKTRPDSAAPSGKNRYGYTDNTAVDTVVYGAAPSGKNLSHIPNLVIPEPAVSLKSRASRLFSLFTLVRFDNDLCNATSGENGTCYTAAQCSELGGHGLGECAQGYGVCCIFQKTCGQSTNTNGTYFVNPGHPSSYDGTSSCQLTVNKLRTPNICQLRLDFESLTLQQPDTNGICQNDQFLISGNQATPSICGHNTGNHMYVDVGENSNAAILTIVTSGATFNRNWKIKVNQIECGAVHAAMNGCTQYFTEVSGTIMTYNYDSASGIQLANQDYSSCVRMQAGFCGIQYSQCTDATNTPERSFSVSGNAGSASAFGGSCGEDWLTIPCMSDVAGQVSNCVDRICGGTFARPSSATKSPIYSYVKPFVINYHTDNSEVVNQNNRGFCLNYIQQPCTSSG